MRKNGVLMHISSLPSPYGIGTLGKEAYEFIDFLKDCDQSLWQMLPTCPTSYGDSPYASYSTFAGNPYFIDLDLLKDEGYLQKEEYETEDWLTQEDRVDYGKLYRSRFKVLKKAVERFLQAVPADYALFVEQNRFWLEDYALFMALKDKNGGLPWQAWPEEERKIHPERIKQLQVENQAAFEFYKVIQYFFYKQWENLHQYAKENGIEIVGDLPIYVALDSVDVWAHPELFDLDENRAPKEVAGCPPDGFSADGQLWGNPLYNWEYHKKTNYGWWIQRMRHLLAFYDLLRIDHFRGFESYYAIPYGSENARTGQWLPGPGAELFKVVEQQLGPQPIIAEDLGFMTPEVKQMLKDVGYPSMKILEFAFDHKEPGQSDYLPYKYPQNSVAYIGTHDNDTAQGWAHTASEQDLLLAKEFIHNTDSMNFHWDMIRTLLASPADTTIVQTQDLLGLSSEGRMNIPSTVGNNWTWRLLPGQLDKTCQEQLKLLTNVYGRAPYEQKS